MALTPAEKQRRYRERKAKNTVTLPRAEMEALQRELAFLHDALEAQSGWLAAVRTMNGSWGQRQPLQYTRWLFTIESRADQLLREQHAIGILDKRYAALRKALMQAITESFRDGTFPLQSNVTTPEK